MPVPVSDVTVKTDTKPFLTELACRLEQIISRINK